jgi:hypothetical protein
MVCPAIDNPASCEIRTVFDFLHTENMSAVEIHRELCTAVYGQNLMGEGTVRQRSKMGEHTFTMRNEVVSRPYVVSDDPVQSVDQNICEGQGFTISELSRDEFP